MPSLYPWRNAHIQKLDNTTFISLATGTYIKPEQYHFKISGERSIYKIWTIPPQYQWRKTHIQKLDNTSLI